MWKNEKFTLGKLNILTARVAGLSENSNIKDLLDLIKDFRNLSIDIMMGNGRHDVTLSHLHTIKSQVYHILEVDNTHRPNLLWRQTIYSHKLIFIFVNANLISRLL